MTTNDPTAPSVAGETKLTPLQQAAFVIVLGAIGMAFVVGIILAIFLWVVPVGKRALDEYTSYGWTVIATSGDGAVEILTRNGSRRVGDEGVLGVIAERDTRTAKRDNRAVHWKRNRVFAYVPLDDCRQGSGHVLLLKPLAGKPDGLESSWLYKSKAGDTAAFVGDYLCDSVKMRAVTP